MKRLHCMFSSAHSCWWSSTQLLVLNSDKYISCLETPFFRLVTSSVIALLSVLFFFLKPVGPHVQLRSFLHFTRFLWRLSSYLLFRSFNVFIKCNKYHLTDAWTFPLHCKVNKNRRKAIFNWAAKGLFFLRGGGGYTHSGYYKTLSPTIAWDRNSCETET